LFTEQKMAAAFPLKIRQRIVTALACGYSPSEVVRIVADEFQVTVSRQAAARHDPRTATGSGLSERLKKLFYDAHERYTDELEQQALAHKAVRLSRLERTYDDAATTGNHRVMLRALDLARREMQGLDYAKGEDGGHA
jgi:hypothetical protein